MTWFSVPASSAAPPCAEACRFTNTSPTACSPRLRICSCASSCPSITPVTAPSAARCSPACRCWRIATISFSTTRCSPNASISASASARFPAPLNILRKPLPSISAAASNTAWVCLGRRFSSHCSGPISQTPGSSVTRERSWKSACRLTIVGCPSNLGVDSPCSIDNDCNLSCVKKKAIIIGAGPAGLTAAYELLCRSDVIPVILEKSSYMGGISRTVNYKGNRIDLGGHRFFSKSDRVMNWWLQHLPVEKKAGGSENITYQQQSREIAVAGAGPDPQNTDEVMLLRKRKSRIYYLRQLFEYPIQLTRNTLAQLGLVRTLRIGFSYLRSMLFPEKEVVNLEQFFINRFGRELYLTFFKDYTEKVWGVPCSKISAEWGEQRIKGLSITKAILHFLKPPAKKHSGIAQKETETSLIEQFLYPKFGPGQMWETVARKVTQMGGEILTGFNVSAMHCENERIRAVSGTDDQGRTQRFEGDYFFSTMPI